jgi:hypothetical protein
MADEATFSASSLGYPKIPDEIKGNAIDFMLCSFASASEFT